MPLFLKPALNSESLLSLLIERGLIVEDKVRAIHYINSVGYYRLSGYALAFKQCQDRFLPGVTFDDLLDLYIFDRRLRLVLLDPLERIEVAIRTSISNHMSCKYGPFWFLNTDIYKDESSCQEFIRHSERLCGKYCKRKSIACSHYFKKYGDQPLPPSWILIEELPMGCWSRLYANMANNQDKRRIAKQFNFNLNDFKNWIELMTILRNICAHHRRLWDVSIPIRPRNLERYAQSAGDITGSYSNFVVIMAFIKSFISSPSWHKQIQPLLDTCPLDPYLHMKFPVNWLELPFWQTNAS